jgi:hypothetical protein
MMGFIFGSGGAIGVMLYRDSGDILELSRLIRLREVTAFFKSGKSKERCEAE